MNFLRGEVDESGKVFRTGAVVSILLAEEAALSKGQRLVLGIRPEDFSLNSSGNGVRGRVLVVEPTGAETHVTIDIGGTDVTCVLRERVLLRPGQMIDFSLDPARAHFFDAETGERIGIVGSGVSTSPLP
jgi:multiple sugar transport system ATP-binding protein